MVYYMEKIRMEGGDYMDENQTTTEVAKKNGMNPLVPVAIIGLIVIAAISFFIFQGQEKVNMQAGITPTSVESIETSTPAAMESNIPDYKDGEYQAVGNYVSPGGAENIGVTLTVKDGIIEDAEVETMGQRPNTIKFQGIFKQNYKEFVVGKNIDEVKLDKVSGSSLSPKGFNDALEKIKTEAKA